MTSTLRHIILALALPVLATHGAYHLTGCASAVKTIDQVNDPSDDVALKKCRDEARAARDAGADGSAAVDVYVACAKDGGF